MSTGRRLAKRSIIGTKVCAPGPDGLWYSGVIQDVKSPVSTTVSPTAYTSTSATTFVYDSCTNIHGDTKYIVRFDFKTQSVESAKTVHKLGNSKSVTMEARRVNNVHISPAQTVRRNAMIKEFHETDLIGPGFRSVIGIKLQPGQRVFFTYNGRETSGDVVYHNVNKDEVTIKVTIGTEEPIEIKKRIEEVRLLESRRSARLADQDRDTDFARLADMSGERRKTHSIDVPMSSITSNNSRKRAPTYHTDGMHEECDEEEMNECNAAMILVNLSNSPKSTKCADKWLGRSPGSTSSSASWSSGSSSPPLSDDGQTIHTNVILNDVTASARIRTTSVSTSDEGIVVDFKDESPRKKRASKRKYKCTWKGCKIIEVTSDKIEQHIRNSHLTHKKARRSTDLDGSLSESDHEEEFYYTEVEDDDDERKMPIPTSPPTLSHRDMARPPHEDPEYQRKFLGNFKQGAMFSGQQNQKNQSNISKNNKLLHHNNNNSCQTYQIPSNRINTGVTTSPLVQYNFPWSPNSTTLSVTSSSTGTSSPTHATVHQQYRHQKQQQQNSQNNTSIFNKHVRLSPHPLQVLEPYSPSAYSNYQNPNYNSNNNTTSNIKTSNNNNEIRNSNTNKKPVILHTNNNNANSVLQQLSQQNITVTAHCNDTNPQQQQQQQPQQQQQVTLPAITITPNYQSHHFTKQHHQEIRNNSNQITSTINTDVNVLSQSNPNNLNVVTHLSASPHHSHQQQPMHQHVSIPHATLTTKLSPSSPNRRTRGENKKCRKVYGMERKDQWCTQCRWKKACSRFND